MDYERAHADPHLVGRTGWLRAAVLGANDGMVSVSALIVGVAASGADTRALVVTGLAGLTAGAMSMAAGEYVSVSSQSDTEAADIAREAIELEINADAEETELASIYVARGLSPETAALVARELSEKDALGAHVRDELGLTDINAANPLQAAWTSALTFSLAAAVPVAAAWLAPAGAVIAWVVVATLLALTALGVLGALAGGANIWRGAARVVFWGVLAMAVTSLVGRMFDVSL